MLVGRALHALAHRGVSPGSGRLSGCADERWYLHSSERVGQTQLEGLIADRNTPSKVVWRAKIVLPTADGLGTMAIMRRTGKSLWGTAGSTEAAARLRGWSAPVPRSYTCVGRRLAEEGRNGW